MGACVADLEHADGGGKLHRLTGQQHQLANDDPMDQNQHDWGTEKEPPQVDLRLQEGERDIAIEQQIRLRDGANRDQQIAHQANKN
jgi:hypothetical protein